MRLTRARRLAPVLASAVLLAGCGGGDKAPSAAPGPQPSPSTQAQSPPTTAPDPFMKLVATANGPTVGVFRSPEEPQPALSLGNPNEDGAPRVFLVEDASRPGWLLVLLPIRPNGSTGWIREADVTLTKTDYRLKVELGAHRLTVWKRDQPVASEPIGVGVANTPTPNGRYYIAELLQPPNPGGPYGPYAYGISGYSDVLKNFGGGNGMVGIHGTNDPSGIGSNVSHGCIRMRNEAITHLAQVLPLGTPVEIVP
jgi:lipoprotein-anchoring transpeptidase ErfK/SrfK